MRALEWTQWAFGAKMTSYRRRCDVIVAWTLKQRHFYVICPLGPVHETFMTFGNMLTSSAIPELQSKTFHATNTSLSRDFRKQTIHEHLKFLL